jgi:hypothetical protein
LRLPEPWLIFVLFKPMPHFRVPTAFAAAILALVTSSPGQWNPPNELLSPDHQYSVTILHTALPGSDPNNGIFTIAVRRGKQDLSKYPTEGYLLDAFWSPSGKYVAVNNRRASAGDYLWVFRLSDGRAIKMPVDAQPGHANDVHVHDKVIQGVTAVYADLTIDLFRKLYVLAHRWTASGQLEVKTDLEFQNLDLENEIGVVRETYKIENEKLVLLARKIEKVPRPPVWPGP